MKRTRIIAILQALLAAALFGSSAPLSKLLLGQVEPIPLAGLLYLGSGLGLLLFRAARRAAQPAAPAEAPLQKTDLPWLAGAILAGGIAAPILLMLSLRDTPAATAALLLNFEGAATTLIAALAFQEAVSRRAAWAVAVITLGCVLLSVNFNAEWGISLGALGILAACGLWGADNNFTRHISAKDPLSIVIIKGLVAGMFSIALALLIGSPLPGWGAALGAMALGSLSYGLSITLFIRAMRGLGAARTSALFSTAPLAGLLLSLVLFRDPLSWLMLAALPLMAGGALLLIDEQHEHTHTHAALAHDHAHCHDDGHHDHTHADGQPCDGAHAHLHIHPTLQHQHAHLPDIHHRHAH